MKDEEGYVYETGYKDACQMIVAWMLNNQATFDSWEIYAGKLLDHATVMMQEQQRILKQMEAEE
jgi:hypothetical protein